MYIYIYIFINIINKSIVGFRDALKRTSLFHLVFKIYTYYYYSYIFNFISCFLINRVIIPYYNC